MKVRITASTGTTILVWREHDTYCARRVGAAHRPEVCLAVDLFEVIAELAGLDLDREEQASEAIGLADHALERLADDHPRDGGANGDASAESRQSSS